MRPRFLIAVIAVAALAIGALFLLPAGDARGPTAAPGASRIQAAAGSTTVQSSELVKAVTPTRVAKTESPDEAHEALIRARAAELMDLATTEDPNSLQTIAAELSNPDPDIRKAAVDATVQFGSQDAIPFLETAVLWAQNAREKQEFADAIELLSLPRLDEAVADSLTAETPQPTAPAARIVARPRVTYRVH
jgi:hypothetical protein